MAAGWPSPWPRPTFAAKSQRCCTAPATRRRDRTPGGHRRDRIGRRLVRLRRGRPSARAIVPGSCPADSARRWVPPARRPHRMRPEPPGPACRSGQPQRGSRPRCPRRRRPGCDSAGSSDAGGHGGHGARRRPGRCAAASKPWMMPNGHWLGRPPMTATPSGWTSTKAACSGIPPGPSAIWRRLGSPRPARPALRPALGRAVPGRAWPYPGAA